MNEIASAPVHANAIVPQKIHSGSWNPGMSDSALIGTADPNCHQIAPPIATRSIVSSQRAYAPAPLSHFATLSPRRLSQSAMTSIAEENPMK
jgi:hypothetical protein